jgi:hypothetical protein
VDEPIDYEKTRFEDVVHDVGVVCDPIEGFSFRLSPRPRQKKPKSMMCARPSYLLREVHRCWLNLQRSSIPDVDSGKIKPMVETVLPLSEARHAHELNETGNARGKIVLQVAELFRNWLAIRSGQTGVKGGQQSPVCLLRMSIMRQIAGFTSYLGSLHEQFTSL